MNPRAVTQERRSRSLVLRVRWARFWFMLTLIALMVLLVRLQVMVSPTAYTAVKDKGIETVPIKALRGSISDRNGYLLAATVDTRNIFADQRLVTDPAGEAGKLADLLRLPASDLQARLTGDRPFIYLAKEVPVTLWEQIDAMSLPGIYSEHSSTRSYADGILASNVVGHINAQGVGDYGIEASMNELLAGTDGSRKYSAVTGMSTSDQSVTPAVNGSNVRLTIDRDIQWLAQKAIVEQVKRADAQSGTVIVMNAQTGEVLAMAMAPTFDANNVKSEDVANMGNVAVSDMYEPGSTGKVMTMAAGIEEGVAHPNSRYSVPNHLQRSDKNFSDHADHPTLRLTLTGVLAKSSNIGTILASEGMKNKTLWGYFNNFGIGQATGVGLPSESAGSMPAAGEWWGSTRYTMMFGQGYAVTSLQAASVFATLANDGVRVPPRIVAGYTDANGTYRETEKPEPVRVVSAETARTVRLMMESVVSEEGTAPRARIPGYRVAGKTGTAQMFDSSCGCMRGYVASFIGLAPADKPQLVVAVALTKPKNGHYGGILAAPVFKKVMTAALEQMRIPPTGAKPPKMKLTW